MRTMIYTQADIDTALLEQKRELLQDIAVKSAYKKGFKDGVGQGVKLKEVFDQLKADGFFDAVSRIFDKRTSAQQS